MKGSEMKGNWSKKMSLLVVMVASVPFVSLKAAEVEERKEEATSHILAEEVNPRWKTLSDEEEEKGFISLVFTPLRWGFQYLTEGERAVVRETFREAEKKARRRGHVWFWKEAKKAELAQEAEDQKAFESALSPYMPEGERKKAWKAFNEKRWGNPRRESWWNSRGSVDLEKRASLFRDEDGGEEKPFSEKEQRELWGLLEGFFHDSYLYLTVEERGKVWEIDGSCNAGGSRA